MAVVEAMAVEEELQLTAPVEMEASAVAEVAQARVLPLSGKLE